MRCEIAGRTFLLSNEATMNMARPSFSTRLINITEHLNWDELFTPYHRILLATPWALQSLLHGTNILRRSRSMAALVVVVVLGGATLSGISRLSHLGRLSFMIETVVLAFRIYYDTVETLMKDRWSTPWTRPFGLLVSCYPATIPTVRAP